MGFNSLNKGSNVYIIDIDALEYGITETYIMNATTHEGNVVSLELEKEEFSCVVDGSSEVEYCDSDADMYSLYPNTFIICSSKDIAEKTYKNEIKKKITEYKNEITLFEGILKNVK